MCVCVSVISVWYRRRTLSIQRHIFFVYIYLIRTSAACYYIIIIIIIVGLFSFSLCCAVSPLSAFLFYRFVHIYSFHFGPCWKSSFRIRFLGDVFFVISNVAPMFMNLYYFCATWMTIFDWTKQMNERAWNETWFESNVRIIYFGFWFHGRATSPTAAAAVHHTMPYQI